MEQRSSSKLAAFRDAVVCGKLPIQTAMGLQAHPTLTIPGPMSAEMMAKPGNHPSLWEQYYWAANPIKIDYNHILSLLPEHGIMLNVQATLLVSACVTFHRIDDRLVIDFVVPKEYRKLMKNVYRIIFVEKIVKVMAVDSMSQLSTEEQETTRSFFYAYDSNGKRLLNLDHKDVRENPLEAIAVGYKELFCRWLGFCSEFDHPMEVTVTEPVKVKHTAKPGLKLKSNWDVAVEIGLQRKFKDGSVVLPVIHPSAQRVEEGAIAMLTEVIGVIAENVTYEYWGKLRTANSKARAQYVELLLDTDLAYYERKAVVAQPNFDFAAEPAQVALALSPEGVPVSFKHNPTFNVTKSLLKQYVAKK